MNIKTLKGKVLDGNKLSFEEAKALITAPLQSLIEASHEITSQFCNKNFDMCSIINAKSGRCSENCKWCAQSAFYKTNADIYDLVPLETCLEHALYNEKQGIHRFSLVTSGRKLNKKDLDNVYHIYRQLKKQSNIYLCASLGLLNLEELKLLKESGVSRYHCNLETAPSLFHELCSTHQQSEKINTIKAARESGMDICSGGIIGMGESFIQRIELAMLLRELDIKSIPINILMPIQGTPLANNHPLSEEDILRTIAIFRFINPDAQLRFSGGRTKLSLEGQKKALSIGINAAIVGDLLTTVGSTVQDDKKLFKESGYNL